MLEPADRALVSRDPAVPGLEVLLDPEALLDHLADRLPDALREGEAPRKAEVTYVRYKPGTSLRATLAVETATGRSLLYAGAWSDRSKARGVARKGDRAGVPWVPVVEERLGIVLAPAEADPRLPGVAALSRKPAAVLPRDAAVQPLRYKPDRRWVGVATRRGRPAYLVKAHRPQSIAWLLAAHARLSGAGLPLPALVAAAPTRGLITTRWVDGRHLVPGAVPDASLQRVAAVLAAVHAVPAWGAQPARPLPAVLTATLPSLAAVAPDTTRRAEEAAARIVAALDRPARSPRTTVHGDFSADQVVEAADGAVLLDVDRSRADDPAVDLASWVAVEVMAGAEASAATEAVRTAYLHAGGADPGARLAPLLAAALLLRAAEPFRTRRPGWADEVNRLVDVAVAVAGEAR